MNCQYGMSDLDGACRNVARYLTEEGVFLCGLCDLKTGSVSIRLTDISNLLNLLGDIADRRRKPMGETDKWCESCDIEKMVELIQKRGVTFL